MNVFSYRSPYGFKITSKETAKEFLNNLIKGGETVIVIGRTYAVIIRKEDKDTTAKVYVKNGNIYDLFNPMLQLDEDAGIREIFKHRKIINERYF